MAPASVATIVAMVAAVQGMRIGASFDCAILSSWRGGYHHYGDQEDPHFQLT